MIESDTAAAQKLLERITTAAPGLREVHKLLWESALRRCDFASATQVMDVALSRWPNSKEFLSHRSDALYNTGRFDEARADLERRVERDDYYLPAVLLGLLLHSQGEPEAALRPLNRALMRVATAPIGQLAQVLICLMRVYRDLGRTAEADDAVKALGDLYAQKPAHVSSMILGVINRRDCWEWDRYRSKDGLARAFKAAGDEAPRHPATYLLPGDAELLQEDAMAGKSGPVWIVKPTDLFGGQGMVLTDDVSTIDLSQDQVVQHYVDRPHLVNGHKAHLRTYVLITGSEPLRAWFYRDGLVRFAPARFEKGDGWLSRSDMHITNTALHEGHPGVRFNPDPSVENDGTVWGLAAFAREVVPEAEAREAFWQSLEDIARRLLNVVARDGLFTLQAKAGRTFRPKLIGLDIVLDEGLRPWLLEIQRMPGQTGEGPVNTVNTRLCRTIFEMTTTATGPGTDAEITDREHRHEEANAGAFRRL
ncbi:MAG: hypothetical protein AAFU49_11745 [Pseudomonadota bacterium]